MKNLPRIIAAAASLGLVAALAAQSSDRPSPGRHGPGGPGRHGRGSPLVRVLDADHDHVISAAEIANAPAALRTLDANGDGIVSADELRPARPADAPARPEGAPPNRGANARPHPADPLMLALDANQDGVLSAVEIANAAASLGALDANGDGTLTIDEIRPLPPAN